MDINGTTDLQVFDEPPEECDKVLRPPDIAGHGLLEQVIGES
jgi:hypothetical protein